MSEITEALNELKSEFEGQFKQLVERSDAEKAERGAESGETKQAIDRVQDRLDEIEAKHAAANSKLAAKAAASKMDPDEIEGSRKASFDKWLRKGERALDSDELKGMTVSDDSEGGFMAPPEAVMEIVSGVVEFSPIVEFAEVRNTSARSVTRPKRVGHLSAQWSGEVETRAETDGLRLGMDEIPTHELYARVYVSTADLEDTDFDLESYIWAEMREQFGVAQGTAFVSGNGVKKPYGFLADTSIATVNSGHASQITSDAMIDTFYALADAYARNGRWIMKRSSIRDLRKLKDLEGRYIWDAGITGGPGPTILDSPYTEAVDMPAIASSAKPIAFGDWKRGYTVVNRLGVSILRDPYTKADVGQIVLHGRLRVGGQVRDPNALRTITIAA